MAKKIGVLLSGCGVKDGSEIHEATLTMLALDKLGVEIVPIAINKQFLVTDHSKGLEVSEKRNILVESARISRGNISDAARVRARELDGLIIPGGTGAVMSLCTYTMKKTLCTVDQSFGKLIAGLTDAGKPIGAMCIAPIALATALKDINVLEVKMTIGNDPAVAEDINTLEQVHVECSIEDCVVDEEHKIVTTPAYMLGQSISEIQPGIEKLVKLVVDMA